MNEASPAERPRFELGLRTGYAIPMGEVPYRLSGQVPVLVEIGARVVPNVFLGGYLGASFGDARRSSISSIKAYGLRMGGEVLYHLAPDEVRDPWLGYGFGVESVSIGGVWGPVRQMGLEFAHIMGGVDFRVSRVFGLGPFFDFSIGEYTHYYVESAFDAPGPQQGAIRNRDTHVWLAFGMRGMMRP